MCAYGCTLYGNVTGFPPEEQNRDAHGSLFRGLLKASPSPARLVCYLIPVQDMAGLDGSSYSESIPRDMSLMFQADSPGLRHCPGRLGSQARLPGLQFIQIQRQSRPNAHLSLATACPSRIP